MTSSLPTLRVLPFAVLVSAGIGYISAKIAGSSPSTWAKISAISTLAQHALFHLASAFTDDLKTKHYLWAILLTASCSLQIIALRQFNMIARTGTVWLSAGATIVCLSAFSKAQKI
jgi:hypothetical protein